MALNIIGDYRAMLEDTYIENKGIFTVEINKLQKKLKESTSIHQMLDCMDTLQAYKKVIEMSICFLEIKSPKNPDNVYVNARGSITKGKYDRIWINYYIGKKEDITESLKRNAEIELAKKAIEKLLKD